MFLGSPVVSSPNRTSIRLAVFAQHSRVTDKPTDTLRYWIIGRNSLHLMHSMWPNNGDVHIVLGLFLCLTARLRFVRSPLPVYTLK